MNGWLYSAHDLCRTRLCQAAGCEADAEPGWALCTRCERRRKRLGRIKIHDIQQPRQPDPETELFCPSCGEWKPDEAFAMQNKQKERRQRRYECRECSTLRRREYRRNMAPEKRAAQAARHKARRQARNLAALPPDVQAAAKAALNSATRGIRT